MVAGVQNSVLALHLDSQPDPFVLHLWHVATSQATMQHTPVVAAALSLTHVSPDWHWPLSAHAPPAAALFAHVP